MMLSMKGFSAVQRRCTGRRALSVRAEAKKNVLITGGNTGIGYETAKVLLGKGHDVTIACRDDTRAANAVAKLKEEVPGASIQSMQLDLADLASVRDAAARWLDGGKTCDVLLNNAGVMACPQMQTKDGFEMQMGVNHLGHFLFTNLLLPSMQSTSSPKRIINVSSSAHQFGRINFDDLFGERGYNEWVQYGASKLANLLFTLELDRQLNGSSSSSAGRITVNALHPGVVRTELARYMMGDPDGLAAKVLKIALLPFTKTPPQGAETSIYLASSPEVEGVSAKYYVDSRPVQARSTAYDTDVAARLWQVSKELTAAKRAATV